ASLRERFAAILADPPELQWGNLGLEIDPYSYTVTCTATEEGLLSDEQAADVFQDREQVCAEAEVEDQQTEILLEGFGYDEVLEQVFLSWLADCWAHAGGLNAPFPAEAFFHGYHLDRFDLRRREWTRIV